MSTVSWRIAGFVISGRMVTSTKFVVRLTDPRVIKGGRESTNHRAANIARVAGDTKGHCRGPTRQHDKPGTASRPVLEGVVERGRRRILRWVKGYAKKQQPVFKPRFFLLYI